MAAFLNFDVGGRPYNSQDFAALQGTIIDSTQIYGSFTGDYIINGCTVKGGAGSIWLNNKIRTVDTDQVINNATPFPVYLIEQNSQLNRLYRDGQSKVAFNVFSAIWSTSVPLTGSYITFTSQLDLTNKRLKQQLAVDAVPTSGGTFTGDITVIDSVRTISAYGSPYGSILFGSTGSTGDYQTGIGFNHMWNGSNYVNFGDGTNNASGAVVMRYTNGAAPTMRFILNPTSNGSDRFLSNVDIDNNVRMTLDAIGNLTVANNIIANEAFVNRLTVNKVGSNSSISFPAQANDPAFINHYEFNNQAVMTFSVSDDFGTNDWFSFGAGNQEGVRIFSNGQSIFRNNMNVQGTVTAGDFIFDFNGSSVATLINNLTISTAAANSNANNAISNANTAISNATIALNVGNAAQSTANSANTTANTASNNAATALTIANKLTTDIGLIFQSVVDTDTPNGFVTLLQIPTVLDRTTLLEVDMIATRISGSIAGAVGYRKNRYLVRNLASVMTLLQSIDVGNFANDSACGNTLSITFVGTDVRVGWASSPGSVFRVKCKARVLDN
jgi:hypothetical protein